jgi:mannan endo-1,4-beta-mannosidase
MNMKYSYLFILLLALCACGRSSSHDPLGDTGKTQRTEHLLANLTLQADSAGYLFGHSDASLYGVGWDGDSLRSDVHDVCGDQPALLGLDLTGVGQGRTANARGTAFSRIRTAAMNHFDRGGAVVIDWRPTANTRGDALKQEMDSLASFLRGLVMPYGMHVPVLLQALPDGEGWWGRLSDADYRRLWQLLAERLQEADVHNVLLVYSYSGPWRESRYPGDKLVNLLGIRLFTTPSASDRSASAVYGQRLESALRQLAPVVKQHHKPMAIAMTGMRGVADDHWWTEVLAPVIDRYPLAYVLFGPNANRQPGDYYVPYPGQQSASDFVKFYNRARSLFLSNVNGLYLGPQSDK